MSIVHKFLAADSTALSDKRQVLTVCSTGGVDRQGDIVVQSGIDTKSFMRAGGTVLWGHDPDKPIAKALSIGVEGGSLRALVQFPPAGVSAKSDETYGLIKAGIVNATSIGFAPVSSEPMEPPWNGLKYLAVELMEFSFVSVPAMPEATVIARSYRGRGKSADLSHIDNEADRLAMLMGCLVDGTRDGKKAIASHEETREHIDRFGGLLLEGLTHARALARAGLAGLDHPFGSADETGERKGLAATIRTSSSPPAPRAASRLSTRSIARRLAGCRRGVQRMYRTRWRLSGASRPARAARI